MTTRIRILEHERPDGEHVFTLERMLPYKRSHWTWTGILPRRITEQGEEWTPILWAPPGMWDLAKPWEFNTRDGAMAHVRILEFNQKHGRRRLIAYQEVSP